MSQKNYHSFYKFIWLDQDFIKFTESVLGDDQRHIQENGIYADLIYDAHSWIEKIISTLTLGISFVLLGLKQMKCMALGSYSRRFKDSYLMNSRESETENKSFECCVISKSLLFLIMQMNLFSFKQYHHYFFNDWNCSFPEAFSIDEIISFLTTFIV